MERIDFKIRLNSLPILPRYGNSEIYLGMDLKAFNDILWNHFAIHGQQEGSGYCMFYTIFLEKSIRVTIDVLTGKLFRIEFTGTYSGDFDGIGIGTNVSELNSSDRVISFDESFIMVGDRPYDFILKINNNDDTIYSLDEVMECEITSIIVEDKTLLV